MSEHRPYRPSNGTEGMGFYENWCARCVKDRPDAEDGGCRILCRSMMFQLGDPEYPEEWECDEQGHSWCTAFEPAPEAASTAGRTPERLGVHAMDKLIEAAEKAALKKREDES